MSSQHITDILAQMEGMMTRLTEVRKKASQCATDAMDLRDRLGDRMDELRALRSELAKVPPAPSVSDNVPASDRIPSILKNRTGAPLRKEDITVKENDPDPGCTYVHFGYFNMQHNLRMRHQRDGSTYVYLGCRVFRSANDMRKYYQYDIETSSRSGVKRSGIGNVINWLVDYAHERGWAW